MLGILAVVVGLFIYVWMFYDFIWPPVLTERQLGKPDEPIEYNIKNTAANIPRLTGRRLSFAKWLGRSVVGNFIRQLAFRKAELDILRKIKIPDVPTLFPIPNLPCENKQHEPVDFNAMLTKSTSVSDASSFKFVTIADLFKEYRAGTVTPLQIAERVFGIIKDTERQTPKLRAIVQHSKEEVLKMAEASTLRYKEGEPLSFMDGIPVCVKEEFNVRLHGIPRNPYNVHHYTGGSSSGSAVAVAAGLCPVALGSDGGGSVRIPAAACGIVGIKASFGRISSSGMIPLAHTVSYAGPLCATVKDAALVYAYLAGKSDDDPHTLHQPEVTLEGFENTSLKEITIGIDWKYFRDCDPDVYEQCEKAVKFLQDQGASVVSIQIPELQETVMAHAITIMSEMAAGLEEEYHKYYNELNAETVSNLGLARVISARDYFQAMKQRTRCMTFLKKIFQEDGVDCVLTPALGMKVPEILEDALQYGEADTSKTTALMRYMGLGNFTGVPCMTLPVGYDFKGLPIGLQVMSSWWNEHVMLRVAHTAEEFVTRKKPQVYYNLLE